jgi:tRNA(fMet)-specific endonuclease VapC
MTYLLDTNTCIKFLTGRSESVRKRIESTAASDMVLCSVVKAELLHGAFKSARREANLERLDRFFERFVSLPFDDSAAEVYGIIRARLEGQGRTIGPNDLLIAAIALSNQRTLVTHNLGEFSRIEELSLEDWE